MIDVLDRLPDEAKSALTRGSHPRWTGPMLATLTDERFSDDDWIFERKLDGVRCLAFRGGRKVRLLSRNRKDRNDTYPELVEAIAAQETGEFVVDGEIVAFEGNRTSFSRLQGRMQLTDPDEARHSGIAVYYYLFDILHLDGYDTTKLPLHLRKRLLKGALRFDRRLRYTPHRRGGGETYLKEACRKGWEGLIAKRSDAPYAHKRSTDWLKFKCVHRQELVIGGYTDPHGERTGFGALLVGYHDDDGLRYAGKVGTGYDDETLRRLGRMLASKERKTSPFAGHDADGEKEAHWVTPDLVGEIGFTEWTGNGRLRHPRFLGLRDDKRAGEVVRERSGT